ncbi:hypothetical protein cypCar_00041332 [Cyprinus carpio]|nr:hypothetical protein cypCar_00041332 [Cyprinus carpio]
MVLKCIRPESVVGTMRWTVNDQDPTLNKVKYVISDDSSTLTVNNVNERDKGCRFTVVSEIAVDWAREPQPSGDHRPLAPLIQWENPPNVRGPLPRAYQRYPSGPPPRPDVDLSIEGERGMKIRCAAALRDGGKA